MNTNANTNANRLWDDIIVGAGSSGSVLASRLSELSEPSEQSERQVLLIEAGPDFPEPAHLPAALNDARAAVMSGYNWDFSANLRSSGLFQQLLQSANMLTAAPRDMLTAAKVALQSMQPLTATLQQFPYFPGKVVGGSSAVNGAIALRPLPQDIERWAAAGNTEWTWEQVLPYLNKIDLPIHSPDERDLHPLQAAFRQACIALGLPGVETVPSNSIEHRRISSATAYVDPARNRKNLTIRAECTVHRILFENNHAIGVEVLDENGNKSAIFGKRITLCAGAINTVAILLRSGIGNSKLCRSLDIPLVADLPGVGENLIDHPAVMLWMTPKSEENKEAQHPHQIMARIDSDLTLFALSNFKTRAVPMLSELLKTPIANGISVVLSHPASRGRVFIKDTNATSKPVIELNFLSAPQDIERLMHGVRVAWQLARAAPVAERTQSIFLWNDAVMQNDNQLKSAIQRFVNATWHAVGTAKMGPADDPMAVVDQHCRVHRVQGLRIADASVMPCIPGTPTNLTCMMIAERVAEWMKEE